MWTRKMLTASTLAIVLAISLVQAASALADQIPAISDLRAEIGSNPDEVILKWGTPFFEIPQEGTKTESCYDIRYGSSTITEDNWEASNQFTGGPPPVCLYSHVSFDLHAGAAVDPDGYIHWDKATCMADLIYHASPMVATPLTNEPIYFEIYRQSNNQLVALSSSPVYTDNTGRATWTSGDLTSVSYENGGEAFDCIAMWPGGNYGLLGGGLQQSDTLWATDTFQASDGGGYPPLPDDWLEWGGVCIKNLDDVSFCFTISQGTVEPSAESNLAIANDVPLFNGKQYPVPGAMYAFTLTLGPDSSTTIYKPVRCAIDYPEYMLEEYGGLGESSLRAYRYDYNNMAWELLEDGATSIDRDDHVISFVMNELGLFALAAELDHDHDGLGDFEEIEYGTDPFVDDDDGDGVSDGDEIWFTKSDPLDALKKKCKDQHWTVDMSGRSEGCWIAARIVAGSYESPISNCAYIGPAITPEYVELWNGAGIFQGDAAWGDFDGDGDPDLAICGQHAGGLVTRTYENQRSTFALRQDLEGIESTGSGCLAWGDYDGDGDLDLAMAGTGATDRIARIYQNDGDGNLTWDQNQVLTGVASAAAAWGDFDWDGDQDLVLTGYDGAQRV